MLHKAPFRSVFLSWALIALILGGTSCATLRAAANDPEDSENAGPESTIVEDVPRKENILSVVEGDSENTSSISRDPAQESAKDKAKEKARLEEGKRTAEQARRNTMATAEYHFAMAQAYVTEGNPDRAIDEYKLALMFDPNSPLIYARLASEYIKKGMLTAALESCKEALNRNPKAVDARLMLAGIYSSTHESKKALEEYDRILKQDPVNEEAVIYKSQVLMEEGRQKEAAANLNSYLKRNSESALAWYYLGRSEQRQNHFEPAVKAFRKAMEVRPGFAQAALALGYLYEEKQQNQKALVVYQDLYDSSQDLSAANRLATLLLKEEKFKEAVPYLDALSQSDPDDMNARVKLGLVYMELKNYDQAIKIFKAVIEKNPGADRIYYYLGAIYEETKKVDLAIEQLKKVSPESKLFSDTAVHVAYLQKQQGKLDEARAWMKDALTKSPRVAGFYIFAASLEEEAKDIKAATQILESALTLFPEDEKVRYYLGSLFDRQGQSDRAIEQMEHILATNPDNVDALNYIGYTWTQKGTRLADAEKLLRKALGLRPNNGYIQDSWGWYLYIRGRTSEAIVELEKAAKLKPDESTILEHLADAYMRSNLREKALKKYEEAARHSDDDGARKKLEVKAETLRQELVKSGRIPAASEGGRSPASSASPSSQVR